MVFLVQPTDADCLNDQEQTIIQPAGVIDVQRQKNATVTLHPPANCMIKNSKLKFVVLMMFSFR